MRIKNWKKHQHFKDRKPPWIKLYRDLLDDIEWHELDPKAAKALVMLWLIASENDGELPDIKRLAFRLRMTENETNSICSKLSQWMEHVDINMISERYQSDSAETEAEVETKKEREREAKRAIALATPDGVSPQVWSDWLALRKAKRAPVTQTVVDGAIREAEKAGMTLEAFLQVWCRRGSQGLEASWLKADERGVSNGQISFAERDELARRQRWEEMTGRKWPTNGQAHEFVDATPIERISQ